MDEEPIVFQSPTRYNIYLGVVILLSVIIFVDLARVVLVSIISDPIWWTLFSTFSLVSVAILVLPAVWKMRQLPTYRDDVSWHIRVQEVTPSEYSHLVKEYRQKYSNIITTIPLVYFGLMITSVVMTVISPYLLLGVSVLLLQNAHYLYGFFLMLFGLSIARVLYGMIPTPASGEFSVVKPRLIRNGLRLLARCPAVSWWGVRVQIGEKEGFYVLKDAVPVGRISGIESDAALLIQMKNGQPFEIRAEMGWLDDHLVQSVSSEADSDLRAIALQVINSYVESTGDSESVAEVLYDLGVK